jgi:hypothetical protein
MTRRDRKRGDAARAARRSRAKSEGVELVEIVSGAEAL